MISKVLIAKVVIPAWGALGFYRGTKLYGYNYKKTFNKYETTKKHEKYEKDENDKEHYTKPQYFYLSSVGYGLYGVVMYVNPIILIFTIPKELYRLEVNIRGLNEEKEKYEFYKIT
jgi:hypothetical protein